MASGDRFYLLELTHRHAVWGDLGSLLKVEGLVVGGEGARAVLMLPDTPMFDKAPDILTLNTEEWSNFLRQSDNPEVLVMPAKAFHRKVRYEISGHVQQKIWLADNLRCYYCLAKMGKAQLTIDHFIPLESGGENAPSNYLTACRKCNKLKGSMPAQDWCKEAKIDYDKTLEYLKKRVIA